MSWLGLILCLMFVDNAVAASMLVITALMLAFIFIPPLIPPDVMVWIGYALFAGVCIAMAGGVAFIVFCAFIVYIWAPYHIVRWVYLRLRHALRRRGPWG